MKQLMVGTAIALVTGFGAMAQDAVPADSSAAGVEVTVQDAQATTVPGFRASKFIGMSLYTLDPDRVNELSTADSTMATDPDRARWTSGSALVSARDQWQDIGKINDVILSQDGDVRGVLLDIGGFLGIGAHTVMVSTDDLYFVADTDAAADTQDVTDFFVVASLSRDQLEALPEWSDDVLKTGFTVGDPDMAAATTGAATAPVVTADTTADTTAVTTDEVVQPEQPSVEDLTGASVQDPAGESVGTVEDLVMQGDQITAAIVDVGGFLGIGAHRVALPIEDLHIVRKDDGIAVDHVEINMTKDQLEALPKHE